MAIKDEFKITRQGKEFVLYAGLLGEAYPKLESIETEEILVEYDGDTPSRARHKATVVYDGKKFTGHGDADTKNVGRNIAPHLIRMSETRAKARALRDAINVGMTAFDELGPDDEEPAQPQRSENRGKSERQPSGEGRGGGEQRSEPREGPADSTDHEKDITKTQVSRVKKLVDGLAKRDGTDPDEALAKLEEKVGHPLDAWSQGEAKRWIKSLDHALNSD